METQNGSRILERVQTVVSEIDFEIDSKIDSEPDSVFESDSDTLSNESIKVMAKGTFTTEFLHFNFYFSKEDKSPKD